MKKHEQWSNNKSKDKTKKSQSSANNASLRYDSQAKKAQPRPKIVVYLITLFLCCLTFPVISQLQIKSRQTVELSLADKSFLAGDYKKAEAEYTALLTDIKSHHASNSGRMTNRYESFTLEKLALAQMAQNNFADAEKNLDAALEMHILSIDHVPQISNNNNERSLRISDRAVKDVLRVLNNKSQLYYLQNKKEMVPAMLSQTWDKVLEQKNVEKKKSHILKDLVHAQAKSLEKRHLNNEAAALNTQLAAIIELPKEERADRYLAVLKEQLPPTNAQPTNCDLGVFSAR